MLILSWRILFFMAYPPPPPYRLRSTGGPYYGGGLGAIQPAYYTQTQPRPLSALPTPSPSRAPPGRRKGQLADYGAFLFWVRLLLVLAWTGVLLTSLIWRGINESLQDYASHLTNWSWALASIFYFFDLVSHLDPTGRLAYLNVLSFWWMTWGLQWVIFWLMFLVLKENPDLLLEASDREGGDLPLGTVLDGDRLLHIVPVVVNILYLVLARSLVLETVSDLAGPRTPVSVQVIYWLYAPFLSAIAPILLYLCIFDPQEIYGLSSGNWVLAAIAIGSILLFSALPFMGFVVKAYHRDKDPVFL